MVEQPENPNRRHRASTLCLDDDKVLTVTLEDPATKNRFFSLPGGAIEKGESPSEAARRETLEETGYEVKLAGKPWPLIYEFEFAGKLWLCHGTFYNASLKFPGQRLAKPDIQDPHVQSVTWLTVDEFLENLAYHQALIQHYKQMMEAMQISVDPPPN